MYPVEEGPQELASATIAAFELFDGMAETASAKEAYTTVRAVLSWSVLPRESTKEILAVLRAKRGLPDDM